MSTQNYLISDPKVRFFVGYKPTEYTIYNLIFSPMQMAELGKKIDEQALGALTKDLEKQLAQKSSITSYNKLKSTQQVLADLFSDDTYASHNTKVGLEKTKAALQKVISEREKKGGVMPQYVAAMKKDLETVEYRLTHLEKLNDVTSFAVNQDGEILVDDMFLKTSNDITRTGIDVKQEGITLGGKEVKVLGIDKNKIGDLLCNIDGQDFVISHEGDKISVKPSSILLKGSLEISLLGVYGKEEAGNTTKRVGQEKKVTIKASVADQKAFKEQDDKATLKAITDIDSVQDISGKTIDSFLNNQTLLHNCIDTVFTTHDATKIYWKYLDASQKKLFIDDMLRSHTSFAGGKLLNISDAKNTFFEAILAFKNSSTTPKTTSEMQDAFVGFHKNQEIQKIVGDALQNTLQKNIESATDDTVKNNLAQFYKKYSTKQVSEFDLFYNKLENDQTGAFTQIKEAFETVKQDTMFEAFKDAMGTNPHVKAEKINNEGVWENIPGDQQARFCMQMVFQNDANSVYAPWDRIQYIPALHHKDILGLESFLETFKDEISTLAKNETDPAKLRGTIKTLILEKLGDSGVKNVLKNKLLKTFGDKISQNIAGGSTNVLNEMNKFAIDAKAFQPGYKKYIEQNKTNPVNNNAPVNNTDPASENIELPDDFKISEFEEGQEMTMNASISDVSRVYEEQAEHAGEEALRKEYEALGKFDVFKGSTYKTMLKRMNLYFFRETKKNKVKQAELEKTQTNGVDMHRGELTAAADRHERMFNDDEWNNQKNENDRIDWLVQKVNDPRIDELCKEYLNSPTGIADKDFEDRFNALIATNSVIPAVFKDNKMKHTASNILLKLRAERGYKTMMEGILHSLEVYASNSDDKAYQTSVKNYVTTYVNLTQRAISPNLQKALTAPGAQVEKYRRYLRHEIGMAKMQANTLKIKLDVLTGGKGAYEVNNRDKKTNVFAWLGRRLDNNPKTALALSIGLTAAAGIFAPPAYAGWVTFGAIAKGVTWIVSKKAAHYTKEQEGQEKKLVRELDNEKNKLSNLKGFINKASFWQKTKNYRTFRQGRLYANTTQFEFMNDAKKDLENIKTQMLALNKPGLQNAVADALARIDYYVTSGHNFFGQQNDKEMEETMNDLQKIVESGAETLGTTKAAMRNDAKYTQVRGDLDAQYTTLRKKFKTQRTLLGVKYGLAAAVAGFGLRHVLGNDVNKHSFGGSDGGTTTVPGHTPNTPPVNIPNQTPPTNIYAPDFDANIAHHSLYDPSQSFAAYGMSPEEVYTHCSNINVLDPRLSETITDHMMNNTYPNPLDPTERLTELNPANKNAVLSAVDKLVHSHIPPSPDLQEEVAKYLYHFAERDAVMGKIIGGGGDAVKDIINDGGSGQKGWLDAFLGGGETLARYLANIASVASPLYANTFLGNPKVPTLDKNGKKPGDMGYIPTFNNTIVDPNKKPVPGGFENEDPLNWIIRKGSNNTPANQTPVQNIPPANPVVNPSNIPNTSPLVPVVVPNPDANVVVLGPTDDTELKIQQELEEAQAKQFVDELTPAIQPLHDRYNALIKDVYQDILADFEAAKNEADLAKKISALQSLQSRSQVLKDSIQTVKSVADDKYDTFKQKFDLLSPAVQAKVQDKLADLEQLRNTSKATIQELGIFIQTLTQAIVDVGTIPAVNPVATVVTSTPATVTPAKTTPAPVKKTITPKVTPVVTPVVAVTPAIVTPAKTTPAPIVKQQPKKVFDMLKEISIPDKKLSKTKYHNALEDGYSRYLSIVKLLEGKQRDIRGEMKRIKYKIESGEKVNQKILDEIVADIDYLNERVDAFTDSFEKYYLASKAEVDSIDSLNLKATEISDRNDRIADTDENFDKIIDAMTKKNTTNTGKKVVTPATNTSVPDPASTTVKTTTTTTVVNNPAPVVVNTTVVVPTITDDSILAEFNALKGNKILRILKKDNVELFNKYKAILEKNPDMYNYVASKKEIAINGILDKSTWVGQAK